MLKKLMKYEMPAAGRKLLPLYGALLAAAVMLGIMLRSGDYLDGIPFMMVIFAMLYSCVATAVVVMTFVVIIQRFNQGLLGDGGDFNLALPVRMDTHLWNKTLTAGIWTLFAGFVGVLSALIVAGIAGGLDLSPLLEIFTNGFKFFIEVFVIFLEMLIVLFAAGCKLALQIYTAITIGHQAKHRKGLCSFGAYCGIVFFEGIIGTVALNTGIQHYFMEFLRNIREGFWQVSVAMITIFAITAAFCALYFLITEKQLNTRLNLQ